MAVKTNRTDDRVLILAAAELSGPCIGRELHERGVDAETEIKIVAPVLATSHFAERAGAMDEQRGEARERLRASLACLVEHELHGEGWVGDSDPLLALEDALAQFPAETVIVATHPESFRHFAEEALAPRAAGRLETDLVHVVIDCDEERPLQKVEEVPAKPEIERRAERQGRWERRDLLALGVGVLGTAILGILALGGAHPRQEDAQGEIQLLVALGAFFLTFWGGAALLFGEATERRRGAIRWIADALLFGVLAGVLLSAILSIV